MSNFKQLGIGLEVYVNDNDNRYSGPLFDTWGGAIYDSTALSSGGVSGTEPDHRVSFRDISGERPEDLLWCPLFPHEGPVYNGQDKWSRYYLFLPNPMPATGRNVDVFSFY